MNRFLQDAESILSAAEVAASRDEGCSELTILIGEDGGIQMLSDSDWPLDSLALHHGASAVYRVSERGGEVCVEGWSGGRTCLLRGYYGVGRVALKPRARLALGEHSPTWRSLLPPAAFCGSGIFSRP